MSSDCNEWKKYLVDKYVILIKFCPNCGNNLKRIENHYFPDRDSYYCVDCKVLFTPITPEEIIITREPKNTFLDST